jgi:hypothetical protein
MRLPAVLLLLLLSCRVGVAATEIRVSECLGAHGERVFSDSAGCATEKVREWTLPLPPVAAAGTPDSVEPARPKRTSGGSRSRPSKPEASYLCSAGNRSWYQHSPCRSGGTEGERVRQERVSRQHACEEIARPASLLRRGSEGDERAGPYARASGRDPCR